MEEDLLSLTVEDNLVYRERSAEVRRILEKIFTERCGLPAEVRFSYVEPAEVLPEDEAFYIQADRSAGYETGAVWQSMAAGQNAAGSQSMFSGQGQAADKVQPGAKMHPGAKINLQEQVRLGAKARRRDITGPPGGALAKRGRVKRTAAFPTVLPKKAFGKKNGDGRIPIGNRRIRMFFSAGILTGIPWKSGISRAISGAVVIRGKIMRREVRELRSGRKLLLFDVTDFTDSITVKMFLREDQEADALEAVKEGAFIKLKGITSVDAYDKELTIGSLTGIKKCEDFYLDADGRCSRKAGGASLPYKNERYGRGFRGEGFHQAGEEMGDAGAGGYGSRLRPGLPRRLPCLDKGDSFKVLYGVEGYLVDDEKEIVQNSKNQSLRRRFRGL